MGKIVAIVGRPNVGKSTLFNRLIGKREAIVNEEAGVTRDRHYGKTNWNGKDFSVIDTGGYVTNSDDVFEGEIRRQVELAIDEADLILFMVDIMSGITDMDEAVAMMLRKLDKPVMLVTNKADNTDLYFQSNEFYKLGIDRLYAISAMSGSGTGDLLDAVVEELGQIPEEEEELEIPKLAIVGRPNVGKSSLINTLIGEERTIVTDIAGTTRDTINTRYNKYGHDFIICDTAGLRRKSKVHDDVEFYSVMRSIRAIEDSDVCLLLLDATRGIEAQDVNIFHLAIKNNKGVVICVNKWDLMEKETNTTRDFTKAIKERIAPFNDVPILFTSAVTKQRIQKVLQEAMNVYENRQRKVKTSQLNEIILEAIDAYPPPSIKGKYVKIKYATQLPSRTPAFALFCNLPQYVKDPYKRYIENKIREHFNFTGVPINVYFRKK